MSSEKNTATAELESEAPQPANTGLSSLERRRLWRARSAWWFKFFMQPILAVSVIVLVVFAFGVAQRYGWFTSNEQVASETTTPGEEVLYICPMVCVPPSTAPGKCPVCGMDLKAQKASGDSKDRYGLKLDQASIRVANIKTVVAEAVPLVRQIRAIGEISYDEGSLATISSYVDGRIDKLYADYTGVKVSEGDELALLYSPDLYSSQVGFLESIKLMKQGEQTNQRINDTNRQFYESSRQRLIEFGLTEKQVEQLERQGKADSRIRVVSPLTGTVIEKMAVEGQYIKMGQAIYKVADLSTVWLMLEMFPTDAAKVSFGQKVVTKIQSHPGREFFGRVAFIDPIVDSKTQTVRVRVVIPNQTGLIRIGDFATASIAARATSLSDPEGAIYDPELADKWISPRHPYIISDKPGKCSECGMDLVAAAELGFSSLPIARHYDAVVPRNAVLMAGDQSVAYVETEPGRFEFRNVEIGHVVGDRVSIIQGVRPGERVVDSAALLIDSQFNMAGKPSLIDPSRAIPRTPEIIDQFNTPELIAALAELSEADQQSVKQQKLCPVADTMLGSMGAPIAIDVEGRRVWICCEGCEAIFRKDPQKYFAVLDKASAEDTQQRNEIDEAMSSLSEKDRKLAIAQKICPVADTPLGSMGTPIKVVVNGQPVFICCEGCRNRLLAEPQKYLDMLAGRTANPPDAKTAELPRIQPLDDEPLPQMELPKKDPPKRQP